MIFVLSNGLGASFFVLGNGLGVTKGDKIVETLYHIGLLKANFFPHLYNTTPSPLLNVGFPVSRICLFSVQH